MALLLQTNIENIMVYLFDHNTSLLHLLYDYTRVYLIPDVDSELCHLQNHHIQHYEEISHQNLDQTLAEILLFHLQKLSAISKLVKLKNCMIHLHNLQANLCRYILQASYNCKHILQVSYNYKHTSPYQRIFVF